MEQHVGAFGDQMLAIVFDGGDDGFDRFLAEFLGAVLGALVEQLAGVGRLSSRYRAGIDGGSKVMDRKTRHQLKLTRGALLKARGRSGKAEAAHTPAFSTSMTGSRHGSSRIGSPARTIWSLASRTVNSPKWKIDAASTAVACPCRIPSTRWSRLPTPPEAITGTET